MKRPRLLTSLTAAVMTLALASATPLFAQTGTQTHQPPMQGRTPHDPGDRHHGRHGGQYRTSGRTGKQNPWAGQQPADQGKHPATKGNSQLIVEGVELYESDENYQKYIKFLTVPWERQLTDALTFNFGSPADIRKIEDPLRRQIYQAMDKSKVRKSKFTKLADAQDNFNMRIHAIDLMRQVANREVDFGFWRATTPPTANPWYWETIDNPKGVGGKMFCSRTDWGHTPFDAVIHIKDVPFRCDCAATVEVCFFYGAARALDMIRFNHVHGKRIYGLGIPDSNDEKLSINKNARYFFHNLTLDNMIPGDSVYMQNKDDYVKYCPQGYWRGENTIYMGKFDEVLHGQPQYTLTGTPRFAGLGLRIKDKENKPIVFVKESELKAEMVEAYKRDTSFSRDDSWRPAQLGDIRWTKLIRPVTGGNPADNDP